MSRWSTKFSAVIVAILWMWILQFQASAEVISVTVPFVSPKGGSMSPVLLVATGKQLNAYTVTPKTSTEGETE